MRGAGLLAVLAVAALFSPAAMARAGTVHPDSHDSALISRLGAKVTTFQTLAAKSSDDTRLQKSLDSCAAFKKDPGMAFAAVIVLLPALLISVVNEYKPQLTDLRDTLAGMDAHEPLFDQWLAAEVASFRLILQFDNHGKKIDYCKAATVMLDKKATAQDVRDVIGVDRAVMAKLFDTSSSSASATLKRLNPQMRQFFVAAGLKSKIATALTT